MSDAQVLWHGLAKGEQTVTRRDFNRRAKGIGLYFTRHELNEIFGYKRILARHEFYDWYDSTT